MEPHNETRQGVKLQCPGKLCKRFLSKLVRGQKRDARNFGQRLNREWNTRRLLTSRGRREAADRAGSVVLEHGARWLHPGTEELEAKRMV